MLQPRSLLESSAQAESPSRDDTGGAHAPCTVYLVCDDTAARRKLASLVDSAGWRSATFSDPDDFLLHERPLAPGCLVLDASAAGTEWVARLAAAGIDVPIVFILQRADVSMTVRLMKAGASEVLIAPVEGATLCQALAPTLELSRSSLSHRAQLRALRARYATLSRRERQVMVLVVRGRLNKQIAAELGISEITVKAHRGRMMRKMMARSLAELVILHARLAPETLPADVPQRLNAECAGDPHQIGQ